ncbi:long-chain fatty acid--CoA ligase [Bacillus luteolus]|uniref:Long-chain fatty acid--CoA ligase n=1 Tax=Litchfieldia luteola TaxID=682179 RepID=A0ABR9QLB5_9BACI|nr:long-chain fatty acid--CoA ligase [Cytobacillus luteolus]MBE4909272.1 long-chain fatty acid--CoA ligase [Cytobacillus luteolus]MBP1940666.1 fatty-acyl-CoA synthase [Cytobacillus luteolus]
MRWELDWLSNRARISPDATAIVEGEAGTRWTYGQLNTRALNLATYLMSIGVKKGDRIALLSPNHIGYFDFFFACMKLGAIFVPLNWRLSKAEISFILTDCTPTIVAVHSTLKELLVIEKLNQYFEIDSTEYESITERKQTDFHEITTEIKDNDPLAIIYTGGTTGKPKGAVLSHQSILWNGLNTIVSWSLSEKDVTLTYLPMFHTGGLNALSIPILLIGGKVVIASDFEPSKAVELINQEGCTVVLLVPTMYHMIVNSEFFKDVTFPTMHTFLSGGAPCPLPIYQAFEKKGLAFKEGYGLTEAGPNNFFINPNIARFRRGSIGKPMIFNEIKLMGFDGEEAQPGEVGELLIRGKHVFEYYWNNPQATEEALIDGWLYTGDLAKKDEEGFHYIVGRKKEMIISGGENIYPLEVEHCMNQHPAVNEVAVFSLPHPKWGEIVAAVVSLKSNLKVTVDELKTYCKQHLGSYKIPKHIMFENEIPKTHVGKIDKNSLQKKYENIVV